MDTLFSSSWVLVTGASAGLGEEFARQLAARRANLILTARRTDKLQSLARELSSVHDIRVEVLSEDLGAPGGAARLADEIERRGWRVDHLVSNAGFGAGGPFVEVDEARQAEMVRLNCEALLVLSRRFLPPMVARGAGGVIHVASIAGHQPTPYMATYGATKAFVLSLSISLSEETRGSGARVMALCPGPVPTEFQQVAGRRIADGQRAAVLGADEVVEIALRDYKAGRTVSIPGRVNRLQLLGSKLLPQPLLSRLVGRMMKSKPSA